MCLENFFTKFLQPLQNHIYIDGNNVAYSRFNKFEKPMLCDILALIEYLVKIIGFRREKIHCICDPSLKYYIDKPTEFQVLIKEGLISEAPKIADEMILSFALKHDFCFILSNDKFRDYIEQLPSKKWLEDRRISFMIIDNQVCLSPNIDYKDIELVLSNNEKKYQNENSQSNKDKKGINHEKTTLEILELIKGSEGSFDLF